MKIYNYTKDTREFTGESNARQSPREPDVFLTPANATVVEAPELNTNEAAVFNGLTWDVVPDFRGSEYWLVGALESISISKLGETLPSDALMVQPVLPISSEQVRDNALAAIDSYDYGDGRVIQIRTKDRPIIEGVIGKGATMWKMIDNRRYSVTDEDLQAALDAYDLQFRVIWTDHLSSLEEGVLL